MPRQAEAVLRDLEGKMEILGKSLSEDELEEVVERWGGGSTSTYHSRERSLCS